MAEYRPLISHSQDVDDELELLKADGKISHHSNIFQAENHTALVWFAILMAVTAMSVAAVLHISVSSATSRLQPMRSPNDITSTLTIAQSDTNLQKGRAIMRHKGLKQPNLRFPMFMVRTNAADPNKVYHSGPSVFLSPSDSMFYHWNFNTTWPRCYISGWVSPSKNLAEGNKSYIAEGNVSAIEVWDVTSRTDPQVLLKSMSWNSRPKRLSLMGTVNFTSREIQSRINHLAGQELKLPTPLFDCSGEVYLTVEIACKSCRLQFDQIYTDPPLGFEAAELA